GVVDEHGPAEAEFRGERLPLTVLGQHRSVAHDADLVAVLATGPAEDTQHVVVSHATHSSTGRLPPSPRSAAPPRPRGRVPASLGVACPHLSGSRAGDDPEKAGRGFRGPWGSALVTAQDPAVCGDHQDGPCSNPFLLPPSFLPSFRPTPGASYEPRPHPTRPTHPSRRHVRVTRPRAAPRPPHRDGH